jgi:hypothetical protein
LGEAAVRDGYDIGEKDLSWASATDDDGEIANGEATPPKCANEADLSNTVTTITTVVTCSLTSDDAVVRVEAANRDPADKVLHQTETKVLGGDWTVRWEQTSGGQGSTKKRKRFYSADGQIYTRHVNIANRFNQQASSTPVVITPVACAASLAAGSARSDDSRAGVPISKQHTHFPNSVCELSARAADDDRTVRGVIASAGSTRKQLYSHNGAKLSPQIDVVGCYKQQLVVHLKQRRGAPVPDTGAPVVPTPNSAAPVVASASFRPSEDDGTEAAQQNLAEYLPKAAKQNLAEHLCQMTPSAAAAVAAVSAVSDRPIATVATAGNTMGPQTHDTRAEAIPSRSAKDAKRSARQAEKQVVMRAVQLSLHDEHARQKREMLEGAGQEAQVCAMPAISVSAVPVTAGAGVGDMTASAGAAASTALGPGEDGASEVTKRDLAEHLSRVTGTQVNLQGWTVRWEASGNGRHAKQRKRFYAPDGRRFSSQIDVIKHFERQASTAPPAAIAIVSAVSDHSIATVATTGNTMGLGTRNTRVQATTFGSAKQAKRSTRQAVKQVALRAVQVTRKEEDTRQEGEGLELERYTRKNLECARQDALVSTTSSTVAVLLDSSVSASAGGNADIPAAQESSEPLASRVLANITVPSSECDTEESKALLYLYHRMKTTFGVDLNPGWTCVILERQSGASAGTKDKYYLVGYLGSQFSVELMRVESQSALPALQLNPTNHLNMMTSFPASCLIFERFQRIVTTTVRRPSPHRMPLRGSKSSASTAPALR